MEEKNSIKFARYFFCAFVGCLCTVAIAAGFWGFDLFKNSRHTVEVKGLSEKIVRADIGTLTITFKNESEEAKDISKEQKKRLIDELYKKCTEDRTLIMEFLQNHGITKEEIIEESNYISEYNEHVATNLYKRYMHSSGTINIRTRAVEKILPIQMGIGSLMEKGVMISCDYSYKLTNFINIKLEMMREASENARRNAEVFIEPQNAEIDELVYLNQGEVSIKAEDTSEGSGYSSESSSIKKKLRLVVHAGYSFKSKK